MIKNLSASWELTTGDAKSSYGQPVLVNRHTGDAFGPGGILKVYPSFGFVPAREVVRRLAKTKNLAKEEIDLISRFLEGTK